MFHSPVIEAQILLIGIGIFFQLVAFSANRNEKPGYPQGHVAEEEEKIQLPPVKSPAPNKAQPSRVPYQPTKDYYEVEKTEPGVRPGQLLRTAKVSYFNDVNVKPPPKA